MNAPATSQSPSRARPTGLALLHPYRAVPVPVPVPQPLPPPLPGRAPAPVPARERSPARGLSSLAEIAAGVVLLVLWACLWTTFIAGVVSPGAALREAARPAPAAATSSR